MRKVLYNKEIYYYHGKVMDVETNKSTGKSIAITKAMLEDNEGNVVLAGLTAIKFIISHVGK